MPWNGSGAITLTQDFPADKLAGSPASIVTAAKMDNVLEDLADCIEACLNRNGENSPTAHVNWGGFKITNVAAAAAATDVPRARQVAENALQYGGTTGGSANAYTATMAFLSAAAAGTTLLFKANHTNSGASTININSGGAVAIKKPDGSTAVDASSIVSGQFFNLVYDGTLWRLQAGEGTFQPIDATLTSLSALGTAADKLAYTTGVDTWAETALTSAARSVLDDASTGAMRTTLGVAIGSDVQAYDADLAALAGLTSAADKLPYFTGSGTAAVADFTAAGRALMDDAAASNQRTTLGLGTAAVLDVGTGNNNIVQLNGSAQVPAVDGSLITKIGKKFISVTSVSAAATLPVVAGISATYDEYEIWIRDLRVGTTNTAIRFQVTVDAGSNWKTTTYLSNMQAIGAAGENYDSATDGVLITSLQATLLGNSSTDYQFCGQIKFWPNGTATRKNVIVDVLYYGGGASLIRGVGGGFWNGGDDAINGFRLIPTTGTITGTVVLIGVAHA